MNILIVVENTNRAYNTMRYVSHKIKEIDPSNNVKVISFLHKDLFRKTIEFNPNTILVGAISTQYMLRYCYTVKSIINCRIISCMEEGIMTRSDDEGIKLYTGNYRYGPNLIDAFIFCGEFQKKLIGNKLLDENKCSSKDRFFTCGYVLLEFLSKNIYCELDTLLKSKIALFEKKDICMFLTGFQGTDYTAKELLRAEDIIDTDKDIEEQIAFHLVRNKLRTQKRIQYIEQICHIAEANADMLFLVKPHPGEQFSHNLDSSNLYQTYVERFKNIPNIFIVDGNCHIGSLMKHVGIIVHYGSTSIIFSYFSDTYTVGFPFYESNQNQIEQRMQLGWTSDVEVEIENIPEVIQKYKAKAIGSSTRENLKKLLAQMYNYHDGGPYEPAQKIAHLLTDETCARRQKLEDSPLDLKYHQIYAG